VKDRDIDIDMYNIYKEIVVVVVVVVVVVIVVRNTGERQTSIMYVKAKSIRVKKKEKGED